MIMTKINREITKQSIMLRLDQLTSQLPTQGEALIMGRQLGKHLRQRRFQLLIMEIQLTHQQLAIIQRNEYKGYNDGRSGAY